MTREEAIEIVKKHGILADGTKFESALRELIPELRESEDERIRKEIIDFVQWAEDRGMTRYDYHQAKRPAVWIAYLEKQKEQKPSIFPPGLGEVHWNPILSGKDVHKWNLPKDFEEAVYKVANFISPFDSQDELRRVSHRFAEQLMSLAKKELMEKPAEVDESTKRLNDNWMRQHFDDYKEQKPAEWSEEDEKMLQSIIKDFRAGKVSTIGQEQWLKSLPERFSLQPKQEWSEEDETYLQDAIWCVKQAYKLCKTENDTGTCWSAEKWLKSLKPSWKPSEEQMDSLRDTIINTKGYQYSVFLPELYEDLNKLFGKTKQQD